MSKRKLSTFDFLEILVSIISLGVGCLLMGISWIIYCSCSFWSNTWSSLGTGLISTSVFSFLIYLINGGRKKDYRSKTRAVFLGGLTHGAFLIAKEIIESNKDSVVNCNMTLGERLKESLKPEHFNSKNMSLKGSDYEAIAELSKRLNSWVEIFNNNKIDSSSEMLIMNNIFSQEEILIINSSSEKLESAIQKTVTLECCEDMYIFFSELNKIEEIKKIMSKEVKIKNNRIENLDDF